VGVKVIGTLGVEEMLMVMETTAKKRVVRKLWEAGEKLRQIAVKMAPVDEGNLEAAIKIRPDAPDQRMRDAAGRFLRTEIEVYIDMAMDVPKRPGKTVGDYAYVIHEHLSPMGSMNLGEESILKQLRTPEFEVGGGFLTRAADKVEEGLDAALNEALAGLF
jgi:hypothetical protein